MSGDVIWSKGFDREYVYFENALNKATRDQLIALRDAMRRGDDVMDAYSTIFPELNVPQLSDVADCWFGTKGKPQWLWDSALTTDQMHLVMKETTARIAELMLAGVGPIEFWLQCGHPRFRMTLAWEGAADVDAAAARSGEWEPSKPTGALHVWVYVPFNAGYGDANELSATSQQGNLKVQAAKDKLADLIERTERAGGEPENMEPIMTLDELGIVVYGNPAGSRPWRGTPLALKPDRDPNPNMDDLTFTFHPTFEEPPPTMPADLPRQEPIVRRVVQAIEISWNVANKGVLIYHT